MSRTTDVTILFTDLVGSTQLLARLGAEAGDELLRSHFEMLRDAIAAYGGREVKNLGDGLMVTFETPAAGAACAAAMQRVVAQHNEAHPELELGLRVGVHAGEAIDGGGDVFGIPVVIAKRLCDQCVGGQVLVSSVLRERAGGEYVELGVLTLKGLCEPVAVAELDWRAADDGLALAGQGCGSQITTGISRSVHVA